MTATIASAQPATHSGNPPSPIASTPSSRLKSIKLAGPAGRLEALLNEGAPNAPFSALVCHPHPLGGGTMHNKVVYHAMKVLNDPQFGLGLPVLRFNFRGTGLSQGVHDGKAETADVQAALDWLENEYNLPIVAAGFSFGAAMTLRACCARGNTRTNIRALAALGLPTRANSHDYHYPCLSECIIPKLFLSGDQDQFAPAAQLAQVVASASDPKRLLFIPGADHFFHSQLDTMQHALAGWLQDQIKDQVRDQVRDQIKDQIKDQLKDQVRDQIKDQVKEQPL
ncbi:MAG: alpha/beta family hydrolase [Terracidiphilus sp.]